MSIPTLINVDEFEKSESKNLSKMALFIVFLVLKAYNVCTENYGTTYH